MKNKKGFTLVELLAVIVVMAIVAALAIPSVNAVNNIVKRIYKSDYNIVLTII